MLTEYVIAHKHKRHVWSSLTFMADSDQIDVYQDGNVYKMSRQSAELTIQYARQSGDYHVEEITAPLGGYRGN